MQHRPVSTGVATIILLTESCRSIHFSITIALSPHPPPPIPTVSHRQSYKLYNCWAGPTQAIIICCMQGLSAASRPCHNISPAEEKGFESRFLVHLWSTAGYRTSVFLENHGQRCFYADIILSSTTKRCVFSVRARQDCWVPALYRK
jgi:hypothetical protein